MVTLAARTMILHGMGFNGFFINIRVNRTDSGIVCVVCVCFLPIYCGHQVQ